MWIQDVTPNLDPYVYVDGALLTDWYGWCLATVRCAYNAPYSGWCAWQGWTDYTQVKHEDRNFPVGVYFPIWFSGYGGLGHVAIAYVNDQGAMNIWTSPFTHTPYFYTGYHDVDTLAQQYKLDAFVGWSEDIGGMRVVHYQDDTPPPPPPPAPEVINTPVDAPPQQPTPILTEVTNESSANVQTSVPEPTTVPSTTAPAPQQGSSTISTPKLPTGTSKVVINKPAKDAWYVTLIKFIVSIFKIKSKG